METSIERQLQAFIASQSGPFRMSEAIRAALNGIELPRGMKKRTEEELADQLAEDPRFFLDAPGKTIRWRRDFFQGGELLVSPSGMELENGVLLPGHRFAPFCQSEIFPSEIKLTVGGQALGRKEISMPLEEVVEYCSLLGAESMFDFLVAEHQTNAGLLRSGGRSDAVVVLNAFDLSDFYRTRELEPGDALRFRIVDWDQGEFDLTDVVSAERRDPAAALEWSRKLDAALATVIEEYEFYLQIPEQLCRALALAGVELLRQPALGLEEYLTRTDRIEIGYMSGDTALVLKTAADDAEAGGLQPPEDVSVSRGQVGSLEEILQESGCLVQPPEIEAYMFDQFYRQEPDFETFYQRCFGEERMQFADDAQEAFFFNYLEDWWETLQTSYDRFADDAKGPIRARLLEIGEERRDWLHYVNDLEIDMAKLQELPAFDDLAATAMHLNSLCKLLNSDQNFVSGSELEAVGATVEQMAELQAACLEKLNAALASLS